MVCTQRAPVRGKSHSFLIFDLPCLSVCVWTTRTLVASGLETRSCVVFESGTHHKVREKQVYHSATHSLDHLAWDHEVGNISILTALKRSQHCHIQMPSSDLHESRIASESAGAWNIVNCLLAGVDPVRILLALLRVTTYAQNAVLGLHEHMPLVLGSISRGKRRYPNAKVTAGTCLEFLRCAHRNDVPGSRPFGANFPFINLENLNLAHVETLEQALDMYARKVDFFRSDLAGFNNLISFHDRGFRGCGHDGVEVKSRAFEYTVAHLVRLLRLDPSIVGGLESFFQNERLAVEFSNLGFLAVFQDFGTIIFVVQRR
jgi:hypothetical protein